MGHARIIGLDYGSKRLGLAVSDPLKMFAQPLGAYTATTALEKLADLLTSDGIDAIIVGWPVLPDNSEGTMVEQVRFFVRRLTKRFPGVDIILWNEEYTSEVAKELIAAGGNPSMKRTGRGRIDAAAAAIILQEYLDQRDEAI